MKILITGGASGLGKSITACLAASYPASQVFFTYHAAAENAASLQKEFLNTKAVSLDFKDPDQVQAFAARIGDLDIDILVNNALPGLPVNHFHKINAADFTRGFSRNIGPVLVLTAAFIKAARTRKSGKIITVLSAYVQGMPRTGLSAYIAEKQYLFSMAKSWAAENVQFNIQSNCVSPEFMDTPLNSSTDLRIKAEMVKSHPLKKMLTTEEVAEAIKFLVGAGPHLNGHNIIMNTADN